VWFTLLLTQVSLGLTILDLVKHAVKTVIHTLGESDRLSIVAFDSVAFAAFPLALMDAPRKERAVAALESLMPRDRQARGRRGVTLNV